MSELSERFAAWMTAHDNHDNPATPAATVLLLRDTTAGPEVLMVKRNAQGAFASAWVFPGGKVDPEDHDGTTDIVEASRVAAGREAHEEADVFIAPGDLVAWSHWMPPPVIPRRFSTWFFAAVAPDGAAGDVTVDGGEIVDHLWVRPQDALARHATGEVEMLPPTWVTLDQLCGFESAADIIAAASTSPPRFYLTRRLSSRDPIIVAWQGDAGYDSGDPDTPGPRHRLTMDPSGWTFEHATNGDGPGSG